MEQEQKREYNRVYRIANWDRILKKRKEWYAKNADRERERARQYQSDPAQPVPAFIRRCATGDLHQRDAGSL